MYQPCCFIQVHSNVQFCGPVLLSRKGTESLLSHKALCPELVPLGNTEMFLFPLQNGSQWPHALRLWMDSSRPWCVSAAGTFGWRCENRCRIGTSSRLRGSAGAPAGLSGRRRRGYSADRKMGAHLYVCECVLLKARVLRRPFHRWDRRTVACVSVCASSGHRDCCILWDSVYRRTLGGLRGRVARSCHPFARLCFYCCV